MTSPSRKRLCASTRLHVLILYTFLASVIICISSLLIVSTSRKYVVSPEAQVHEQQLLNGPPSLPLPAEIEDELSIKSENVNITSNINKQAVKPYDIHTILLAIKSFQSEAFVFVYDSKKDVFVVIHNDSKCIRNCVRVHHIAEVLSYTLRNNFPHRFNKANNSDWAVILSTGDSPNVVPGCIHRNLCDKCCPSERFAPILHFGSVYNSSILPSAIAMPIVVFPHLPCFYRSQKIKFIESRKGGFCDLKEYIDAGQSDGTQKDDLSWNDLIPQIIWRGTNFPYLQKMYRGMRGPGFRRDIQPKIDGVEGQSNVTRAALKALSIVPLSPRWRGVLLTSESELEAKHHTNNALNSLQVPWINIKFSSVPNAEKFEKTPASQDSNLIRLQSVGISAIGEAITIQQQAKYKYHIDLGGGGGTTWTGTMQKLALPGVLFHHVTPTTDYFYNRIEPWVHYIPVKEDLSDLKKQFEWAEAHPEEAQKISRAGTDFVKWFGTKEGIETMTQEYMIDPLTKCLDAYVSVDTERYGQKTVLDVINEQGRKNWRVVGFCSGMHPDSCTKLSMPVSEWK